MLYGNFFPEIAGSRIGMQCIRYTSLRAGVVRIKDGDQWRTEAGEAIHHMECGYLQICMFAWRHFPELIGTAPRKDKGTPKPQIQQINKHSWRRLGQLVKDLGFGMALAFLTQTRLLDFYNQRIVTMHLQSKSAMC